MKLEAIGPVEKDRELDEWHLEHVTYTPATPRPQREGTESSVRRGREDSLCEADCCRTALLPVQSGMKGETVKWVAVHGEREGHMIRVSRGDESGCVAKEQNDLQEGFFCNRQGTFPVASALRLEKAGGRRRARSKEEWA